LLVWTVGGQTCLKPFGHPVQAETTGNGAYSPEGPNHLVITTTEPRALGSWFGPGPCGGNAHHELNTDTATAAAAAAAAAATTTTNNNNDKTTIEQEEKIKPIDLNNRFESNYMDVESECV